MTPTIEDVLSRYETYVKHSDIPIFLKDNVIAAMQEWASLQTPSNEKYWRERCEAAERFINESPCDPDITKAQIYAHGLWQKLKSTPIPIQTPCVELEKEVERLKELIEVGFKDSYKKGRVHPGNNMNKDFEKFKTENEL